MHAIDILDGRLQLAEQARPVPAAGQLLVRVRAAGVNRADLMQAAGRYPPPAGESAILGLEIAGDVLELGEGVTDWQVGDAVFGLVGGGAYAEYCVLDQALAIRKPAALSYEQAAALPEAWMTAWFNLVTLGQLQAGERALIHAGASGVGSVAIQLARWRGAHVATTVGNAAKADFCRALGAELVINYREQDFADAVKAAGGADFILDGVGGDYVARNQRCLNADGRMILIGLLNGLESQLNLGLLLVKRQTIRGSTLRPQPLATKAALATALRDEVLPALLARRLAIHLDRSFALADAQAAHDHLRDNRNLGKVVLTA
ncbi:NADPH2:quinone reductase [Andreprevotia lacus DSM 23236]|uniref:NADPH2:quinone reductase n=1 Tax=Andreprevotia lacus DSM 23236 TaxID=1121001 RepID=A0A1W1WYQ1_9NEIS|nr:NAD(P)H-quinone oxidoreductase [Andreprevotia lacus]SMC16747.1 NADPH2:quinone reductase [Andreprevotia lacus DSM 23236]